MRKITPIVLAGLFSASSLTVLANEKIDFDKHDKDSNGHLSQSEWRDVQGVNVSFNEADADGDGQVTKMEAKSAAKQEKSSMGYQQTAGSQSSQSSDSPMLGQKSFDELDEDGDGKLSRDEASTDSELASHFAVLDRNGDDQLDQDEMRQVHAVSGQHDVSSGQQSTLQSRDSESQQSEMISFERAGSSQAATSDSGKELSESAFRQVDADGDDRISRDEAEQSGIDYVVSSFEVIDENDNDYIEKEEIKSNNQQ